MAIRHLGGVPKMIESMQKEIENRFLRGIAASRELSSVNQISEENVTVLHKVKEIALRKGTFH